MYGASFHPNRHIATVNAMRIARYTRLDHCPAMSAAIANSAMKTARMANETPISMRLSFKLAK